MNDGGHELDGLEVISQSKFEVNVVWEMLWEISEWASEY